MPKLIDMAAIKSANPLRTVWLYLCLWRLVYSSREGIDPDWTSAGLSRRLDPCEHCI